MPHASPTRTADPADLRACALLVADRCHPPVTVDGLDDVLRALVVGAGHLARCHEPGADPLEVGASALPLAAVAAAGATWLAAPGDPPALEEALDRCAADPDEAPEDEGALWWSRGLLEALGLVLETLVLVAEAPREGPERYEHGPSPDEVARSGLVQLAASALQVMAVLGLSRPDADGRGRA